MKLVIKFVKKNTIINKTKKEYKYLLYILVLSFKIIILATKIINNGFTNSTGWNLGRNGKSIHLFDPFTSMPNKGIRESSKSEIKNK